MTYPGGKGGLFRQLINLIPEHSTYIETHLGHGAVLRHKAPAARSIGVEIDPRVLQQWHGVDLPSLELVCDDATRFLKNFAFTGGEFIYVDPPYVRATRRRSTVYRFDLDDVQHAELLDVLHSIPAKVMLSGYRCELYDERLSSWHRVEYTVGGHGLVNREVVWLNYSPPDVPFDKRYVGASFRERQRIQRKQQRIRQRIEGLPPVERALLLDWMSITFAQPQGTQP